MRNNITNYLRKGVAAQANRNIVFKNENFFEVDFDSVENGNVKINSENEFLFSESKHENDLVQIILVLKTFSINYDDGVKADNKDELTGILFLPALISVTGKLLYNSEKPPWIPREMLAPLVDEDLCIGTLDDYDKFFETSVPFKEQINDWNGILRYTKELYQYVTNADFNSDSVNDKDIDNRIFIIKDTVINSTAGILNLYDDLLDSKGNSLYQKLIDKNNYSNRSINNGFDDFDKMLLHLGQMKNEFSLAVSQKDAIDCFTNLNYGEILAVDGPPGTGKTTLLQSVVATMIVKHALERKDAPIILATSTNNQAITNIIDAFAINNESTLAKKWLDNVKSLAMYFPSHARVESAQKKGYQVSSKNGMYFYEQVEKEREVFKNSFIRYANDFFKFSNNEKNIISVLHNELIFTHNKFEYMIYKYKKLIDFCEGSNIAEYEKILRDKLEVQDRSLEALKNQIKLENNKIALTKERVVDVFQSYNNLPFYVRYLKFIPIFKQKIINWAIREKRETELFWDEKMSIIEVETAFTSEISNSRKLLSEFEHNLKEVEKTLVELNQTNREFTTFISELEGIYSEFELRNIQVAKNKQDFISKIKHNIFSELDFDTTIRHHLFWLAIHYYEARFLFEDIELSPSQLQATFKNVLKIRYQRMALLTPCFVATLYSLPNLFAGYTRENKNEYLYDFADLLIVDEAGQVSSEIGAPVFSLAKKAIVVGDENQIPPVWAVDRILDRSFAINSGILTNETEFLELEKLGLTSSSSSVMRLVKNTTILNDLDDICFLKEHRRCLDEIADYCNELIYKGKLIPCRGNEKDFKVKNPSIILPAFGCFNIKVTHSKKRGTSRYNEVEAKEIIEWIKNNFSKLEKIYNLTNLSDILSIITPFKAQVREIEKELKKINPAYSKHISVGTVHSFQGAEKHIIIFSSVYGGNERCFFIDNNKELMNVAVSRAKDSFLFFGDRECLSLDKTSSSGLLNLKLKTEIDEIL